MWRLRNRVGFSTTDVESLLDAPVLFAGRIVEPAHEEARFLLLGVTADGRRAALVFARRGELSDELKEALRRRGRELGVGYQTAAKMILAKYVNAKL